MGIVKVIENKVNEVGEMVEKPSNLGFT